VTKPSALTIESDVEPDGTPLAFSGFPVNGLSPYTARANIAGYQRTEMRPNDGSRVHAIVLDKSAWPGSSGGPVYGVDGRVMGLLLQTGTGLAFARHGARIHDFLTAPNDRLQRPPERP
jgi:S1-C subfamily serine protease